MEDTKAAFSTSALPKTPHHQRPSFSSIYCPSPPPGSTLTSIRQQILERNQSPAHKNKWQQQWVGGHIRETKHKMENHAVMIGGKAEAQATRSPTINNCTEIPTPDILLRRLSSAIGKTRSSTSPTNSRNSVSFFDQVSHLAYHLLSLSSAESGYCFVSDLRTR